MSALSGQVVGSGAGVFSVTFAPFSSFEWPALPGTYLLGLHLDEQRQLAVGRLGVFGFPAGLYAYVGSACGPGGLRGRLTRHWHGPRRCHWHVDYLRQVATLKWVIWQAVPGLECRWGQRLARFPGLQVPVLGFGATDCRAGCPAHLFLLPASGDLPAVVAWLAEGNPLLTDKISRHGAGSS